MITPACMLTNRPTDTKTGAPRAAQHKNPNSAPLAIQLEPASVGTPSVRAKKIAMTNAATTVALLARAYSRGPSRERHVPGVTRWYGWNRMPVTSQLVTTPTRPAVTPATSTLVKRIVGFLWAVLGESQRIA